jgi:hypothetical protein
MTINSRSLKGDNFHGDGAPTSLRIKKKKGGGASHFL